MSKINKAIAALSVVASFGVAAAPLATFAEEANYNSDSHQDNLNITVRPSCTFGNANLATPDLGVTHGVGTSDADIDGGTAASWTPDSSTGSDGTGRHPDAATGVNENGALTLASGTEETAGAYADQISYSIYAGTTRDDMGWTMLKVYCNANQGYTVKAQTVALTEQNPEQGQTAQTIDPSTSYSATTSGYALASIGVDSDTDPMTVDQTGKYVSTGSAGKIAHKTGVSKDTGDKLKITYGIGVGPSQKAATYLGSVTYTLIQGYASN